jgi:hypothetical protein
VALTRDSRSTLYRRIVAVDRLISEGAAHAGIGVRYAVHLSAARGSATPGASVNAVFRSTVATHQARWPIRSAASAVGTWNDVVGRKRQPMRWSANGAHMLLQVRCAMLDHRLETLFREWFPRFRATPPITSARAAWELPDRGRSALPLYAPQSSPVTRHPMTTHSCVGLARELATQGSELWADVNALVKPIMQIGQRRKWWWRC